MNSVFVLKNGGHVVVVPRKRMPTRVGSQQFIASEPIVLHLQAGRCVSKVIQSIVTLTVNPAIDVTAPIPTVFSSHKLRCGAARCG